MLLGISAELWKLSFFFSRLLLKIIEKMMLAFFFFPHCILSFFLTAGVCMLPFFCQEVLLAPGVCRPKKKLLVGSSSP